MIKRVQLGTSLIEVLVSLLVLSLGVIGAASMQLSALRTTQQSGYQTLAIELAAELANSIRVHSSGKGNGNNPFLNVDYSALRDGEPSRPNKLCYGVKSNCNSTELAAFHIYELEKRLNSAFPTAHLRVCRDASPWDVQASAYKWECTESDAAALPLVIKLGWAPRNPEDHDTASRSATRPYVVLTVMPAAV